METDRYNANAMFKEFAQRLKISELQKFAEEKGYALDAILDGGDMTSPYLAELEAWRDEKAKAAEEAERIAREHKEMAEWDEFLRSIPTRFRAASPDTLSKDFKKIYKEMSDGKSGLLYGKNGPGKTYLAWCAAKDWKKRHETFAIEKGIETMSWIKSHFAGGGDITKDIRAKYLRMDHLVIDEVDKIFETQTDFVYLTYLIDIRYDEMLQTVVITNKTSKQEIIDSLGQSVYSRLTEKGNIVYGLLNAVDRRRHPDGNTGGEE